MWVFLTDAFFSVVDKKAKETKAKFNREAKPADLLVVRARKAGDIERVFNATLGKKVKVAVSNTTDYRFRAFVRRDDFAKVMLAEIDRITYGNFKNEVFEPDRHNAYNSVWGAMLRLQDAAQQRGKAQPYLL